MNPDGSLPHPAHGPEADLGHPQLVDKLIARIERDGPITFADFMQAALYDPEFGYYTTAGPRIGREGDYYTSSDVHPIFGVLLGRQFAQAAALIVPTGEFTIVEQGGGKGLLASQVLARLQQEDPALFARTRYIFIEHSPAMVRAQQQCLGPLLEGGARIVWYSDLSALAPGSLTGVFFSNELVDAFPVHRVVQRPQGLCEIFVGWSAAKGGFIEHEAAPSTPELASYFARQGVTLEDGQHAEVNLQAGIWMRQVGSLLQRGLVLTIDYGHTAADLYHPVRRNGTLLGYFRHTVSTSPYRHIGRQDLTAHVNFTSLAVAGRHAGLAVTGFTNQLHFLMGLGIEAAFAGLAPESEACPAFDELARMRNLLRPDGMGATYKVLAQHKGMAAPMLDGLRFQPYFADALDTGLPPSVPSAPAGREGSRLRHAVVR